MIHIENLGNNGEVNFCKFLFYNNQLSENYRLINIENVHSIDINGKFINSSILKCEGNLNDKNDLDNIN